MHSLDSRLRLPGQAAVRAARRYGCLLVVGLVGAQAISPPAARAGADQSPEAVGMLWTWQQTLMNDDLPADSGSMRFVAAAPGGAGQPPDEEAAVALLEGTPWTLVEYAGPDGSAQPVLPGTEVWAAFQAGRLSGSAGCNTYGGAYRVTGSALSLSGTAGTLRLCPGPPGIMEQEAAYLAALGTARVYRIEGSRLVLETTDGARAASFVPAAESATLSGVVTYRERIALPPNALVRVQLLDVSRADAPAIVVGEQTIVGPGQVPIAFAVDYRPRDIDPRRRYTLRASIADNGGRLLFTTTDAYPVLTQGNPTDSVELLVRQVP